MLISKFFDHRYFDSPGCIGLKFKWATKSLLKYPYFIQLRFCLLCKIFQSI